MSPPAPRRVRVQIDRANAYETFHGLVVGETTSHFKVEWLTFNEWRSAEWFAKDGPRVRCILLDEDFSPLTPP